MASMSASPLRFRRSGGAALLLLAGGLPVQPVQAPPVAAADTNQEDAPSDWLRYKALWQGLESDPGAPVDLEAELAACFGLPLHEFEAALSRTELDAAGMNPGQKCFSPSRYSLAVLAISRIRTLPDRPMPFPIMTRMAYLPPGLREDFRFQHMENPTTRIEELRQRWRSGGLTADTLVAALSGVRADVYRYRALRRAADMHRRHHPAGDVPAAGPADLETLAEQKSLLSFLRDPGRSPIGTDAWLDDYVKAARKVQDELKGPQAAQLRAQEAVLTEALKRLEAASSRLEILFADLEARSPGT